MSVPRVLPELSENDDEGAPCFNLEDAKEIALDNEPHKHVHFGPYEEEWENHHDGGCFMIHKVTIKNGVNHGIIKILNFIIKNIPEVFPILPYIFQQNVILLVLHTENAIKIQTLCGPIFKADLSVARKYYSNKNVPAHEVLKKIMDQRFDTANYSLDLTNLKIEKALPPNMLTSTPGIISLVKLIKKKYPHTTTIIFKDNSLDDLKLVTLLAFNCRSLKTLDISNNNLTSIGELIVLQFCSKLETLFLRHNPFSLKCLGLESYGRQVHHYLPKIKNLDDVDISPKQYYDNGVPPSTTYYSSN